MLLPDSNKLRHILSIEEKWVNGFYGIIDAHHKAKKPLSFLQVMVLCDEAASAPGGMPKPLAILMTYVFGEPPPHHLPILAEFCERTRYWTPCGVQGHILNLQRVTTARPINKLQYVRFPHESFVFVLYSHHGKVTALDISGKLIFRV
jgi:hypothetical protein